MTQIISFIKLSKNNDAFQIIIGCTMELLGIAPAVFCELTIQIVSMVHISKFMHGAVIHGNRKVTHLEYSRNNQGHYSNSKAAHIPRWTCAWNFTIKDTISWLYWATHTGLLKIDLGRQVKERDFYGIKGFSIHSRIQ